MPPTPPPPSNSGYNRLRNYGRVVVDNLFGKYLLWTNTVSCGILMAAGDAVAQSIETHKEPPDKRKPFDWHRAGVMFVVGFTQGPVQHVFYGWLDNRFVAVNGRNVAKKIALDQSIMSPVAIVQFFMMAGIMEGQTLDESFQELRSKFLTVFMVSVSQYNRIKRRMTEVMTNLCYFFRCRQFDSRVTACSGR